MHFMKCAQVTGQLRFHSPKITSDYAVEESNTHTASYRMPKLKYSSAALRE
jgi:hypothetical protein